MSDISPSEIPRYKLLKPLYANADGLYVPEGAEIEFEGPPNEHMVPLNKPAEDRLRAYITALNEGARAAGRDSRHLADIVFTEVAKRPREPMREVTMPTYKEEIPPTGNLTPAGAAKSAPRESSIKVKPAEESRPAKPIALSSINKDTYNVNP